MIVLVNLCLLDIKLNIKEIYYKWEHWLIDRLWLDCMVLLLVSWV